MAYVNEQYLKLAQQYLFANIAKKVNEYKATHPDVKVISLGIGDVTRPLVPTVIEAMHKAVEEMSVQGSFRGYGPEQGYDFLRKEIVTHDYLSRGVELDIDEVFVSDGAKSDTGNIGDIFATANSVGMTDPVYPVYIDTNVMAGRAGEPVDGKWSAIRYLSCEEKNNFVPHIPTDKVDIIYLCYPNNPTGMVLNKEQLAQWVAYAKENHAVILYDAAYEAYIQEEDIPHSIYEIEGAKEVAIEFRSYSKTAGFTGVRCGYTVVPKALYATTQEGERIALNALWNRRQCTKFNGTSYITQRAAQAIYTPKGKEEVKAVINYYMDNAKLMRDVLQKLGFKVYGGVNAPYLWVKCLEGKTSWEMFDYLLEQVGVVSTPGVGFGPCGEGYFRLTAFGNREDCQEAMQRIEAHFQNR